MRFVVGAASKLRHLRLCLPVLGRNWRVSCRDCFMVSERAAADQASSPGVALSGGSIAVILNARERTEAF